MLLPEKYLLNHFKILKYNLNNQKNKKSSLQVQMQKRQLMDVHEWLRASCTASCSASFTVEAALVLPIMLFVMCGFLYFLIILNMQTALYEELSGSARNAARYAFTYEEILHLAPSEEAELKHDLEPGLTDMLYHGFSSVYALEQIKKALGKEWLDQSCIRNGADGLVLISDSLIDNNQVVDMVLRYRVNIPYLPGKVFDLLCVQRVRIRTFTGFMPQAADQEKAEELVYITESGAVYHTNRYCTHLNLSVKEVNIMNLDTLRNSNGGKYYACELCGSGTVSGLVYLTVYGDRYHSTLECSGLKRSWKTVPLTQVGERRLCTRCQQKE